MTQTASKGRVCFPRPFCFGVVCSVGHSGSAGAGSAVTWEQAQRDFEGCVLAACALMGAASLLPLGCPSRHLQEMYGSAIRMIADPLAAGADARALERRLGCLMLSCLCGTLPLAMLRVRCVLPAADSTTHMHALRRGV